MVRRGRIASSAVASLAAALFVISASCGGDDDGSDPTTDAPTDVAAASGSAGGNLRDVDLSGDSGAIEIVGGDAEDLLTGTTSVAMGDFNDDGESDLLIGAPQGDGPNNERPEAGEAYVFFGPINHSLDLETMSPDIVIRGGSAGDGLGYSVLAADINADGRTDVLVGAPGVTAGFDPRTDQGRVYVFYGGTDLEDLEEVDLVEDLFDLTVTGAEGFSRLGHAMAAGDVNGDENEDVVIGAPFAGRLEGTAPGGERTALGEAYIIVGRDDLAGQLNIARDEYDTLISGAHALGEFASSIAVADIDDDGTDDILIGAHRASAGDPARGSSGAAYVFYGRDEFDRRLSTQDGDEDVLFVGTTGSTLGYPVTAGDFDGDGVADVAMGAQLEATGDIQGSGAIHVFFGGKRFSETVDLAEETSDVRLAGGETSEFLPSALASVDLTGDGRDELVAGSMLIAASEDRFGAGVIYIVSLEAGSGGALDLSTENAATILGGAAGDRLGNAVGAGAVSDGRTVLVGVAPLADSNNQPDRGIVYLLGFQ